MSDKRREEFENAWKRLLPDIEKAEREFYLRIYLEGTSQIKEDLAYWDDQHPTPEDDELDTIVANMIYLIQKDLGIA